MKAFLVVGGLAVGNFAFQYFGAEAYVVAVERSFFQFFAVAAYVFVDEIFK